MRPTRGVSCAIVGTGSGRGKDARRLCLSKLIAFVSGLSLLSPKVRWHLRATLLDFVHTPLPLWILCCLYCGDWGMKGSRDTQVH